jgi:hypothetical protein
MRTVSRRKSERMMILKVCYRSDDNSHKGNDQHSPKKKRMENIITQPVHKFEDFCQKLMFSFLVFKMFSTYEYQ